MSTISSMILMHNCKSTEVKSEDLDGKAGVLHGPDPVQGL